MSILASVTEIEDRVVDTVRNLQQPVVTYVRKGVERAEGRLPKLTYPENLPRPGELVESQVNFAKALLDAQRDFVVDLVDAVSPLVRPEADAEAPPASDEAPKAAATPKPRAKSTATKAKK
ncbi:MAG: hypothetical protein ACRD2C_28270 [Acidimicrobiales bacterium]